MLVLVSLSSEMLFQLVFRLYISIYFSVFDFLSGNPLIVFYCFLALLLILEIKRFQMWLI